MKPHWKVHVRVLTYTCVLIINLVEEAWRQVSVWAVGHRTLQNKQRRSSCVRRVRNVWSGQQKTERGGAGRRGPMTLTRDPWAAGSSRPASLSSDPTWVSPSSPQPSPTWAPSSSQLGSLYDGATLTPPSWPVAASPSSQPGWVWPSSESQPPWASFGYRSSSLGGSAAACSRYRGSGGRGALREDRWRDGRSIIKGRDPGW